MDCLVLEAMPRIKGLIEAGEPGPLHLGIAQVTRKLQSFVDVASSIVNGTPDTLDQAQIDHVMRACGAQPGRTAPTHSRPLFSRRPRAARPPPGCFPSCIPRPPP